MNVTAQQLSYLVGNPGAWAKQNDDGSYLPVRSGPEGVPWRQLLTDHLAGTTTVGTYVNKGDQARTLVFDIDQNDVAQVIAIAEALGELGVTREYVGTEFSGRKGYHVWVVLEEYTFAAHLRRLGRAVLAESGVECEVFPKQDSTRDLGSLVKLPGGLHRVSGKRSEVLKPWKRVPNGVLGDVLDSIPEVAVVGGGSRPEAFACMAGIQDGVQEGGRNIALFHLATMLRRGGVTEENLRLVLTNTAAKFDPPLDAFEVEKVLANSENSGPICSQLPGSMTCGEACILKRTPGLYTRPGALRNAADGEYVVMQVEDKEGTKVELLHPDLRQGMGLLARPGEE